MYANQMIRTVVTVWALYNARDESERMEILVF